MTPDDALARTVPMVAVADLDVSLDTIEDVRRRLAETARWLAAAVRPRPADLARLAASLSDQAALLEDVVPRLRGEGTA